MMDDIIYLHGWGEDPLRSPVAKALQAALPNARIHLPSYHPRGARRETRVGLALRSLQAQIDDPATSLQIRVVGYSFGGLLAAIWGQKQPARIAKMLLLAPAIDNVERNYAGDSATWRMPMDYVEELRAYPSRPSIRRPTTLVHGRLDNDQGGSAPERIERWANEQAFTAVFLLPGVDHSLEPWLSSGVSPSFADLARELAS
jgi:esterase/lipase